MEMEKVMAKLASLEDQLQKEAVRREFAGYKVVPQLESKQRGSPAVVLGIRAGQSFCFCST